MKLHNASKTAPILALLMLAGCIHAQNAQVGGTGQVGGKSTIQANSSPQFKITTGSCPSGTLNQSGYTCQITAANGVSPYNCSLNTGAIPPGLQLVGCSIIGTPIAPAGPNAFSITVTDSATPTPNTANVSLNIQVGCPSLSILTPPQIPAGQQGTAYGPFQFQANGGILPLTWSQNGGSLCSGLALDGGGLGQLSGTPTIQQTCNFGMKVADSCNLGAQTASGNFSQQINTNIAVTTTSLPAATAGVFYQQTVSNSGGTGPYIWSLQTGSVLPSSLTLSSGGTISGTVNVGGTYNFTVQVKDSLNATATQALSITVSSAPLVFQTVSPLPSCTQGQNYPAFQMQASGGFGTLTYTAPGLPAVGLNISSSGLITGTCTQIGVFNPTITVTDQSQPTAQSLPQNFQITMKQNIGPLVFNDTTLPNATAGSPYSAGITMSGGVGPYVFNTTPLSGHFPNGLTLNTNGTVSGTATVAEADTPDIQVSDSEVPPQTAHSPISITSVCPAITSTNGGAMPPAKQGTAYSFQVTASPGYGTLSYSIAGQPTGLSINSATGLISGTPSVSGAFNNIVVTVQDQCSPTPQTFPINLTLQVNTNLGITTASPLPAGQVGVAYSLTFHGSGGTPPYTWTSGTLPGGLSLTSAGLLSGAPSAAGTFTFTVTLTDSVPNSITASFTITINPATQTTPALPDPALLNWNTNISNTPSPGTVRCVGSPGVACGASYATIPLALAAAACGDTIVLQNTQYVIIGTLTFSLQCNQSNWLTITRDTSDTTFPAELSNVNPCYAGLASTALVGLPSYTCNSPARHMPQIEKSGVGASLNVICSYCRFNGIEWTRDNTYDLDNGIINMAITTCTNPDLTCMNSMPTNIIFDRNIVHGDAQRQTTRGVSFSGTRWDAFINSYCYDIGLPTAGGGGDAQCLQSGTAHNFTNVGLQKVINDFISASTMPQLTGGAFVEPVSPTTGFDGIPHDIWNAYWWAYANPLWNTQIGQEPKAAQVIEGVSYPAAADQELTVQPTAVQVAVNGSFQFQLLILNDSRQGINRTVGSTTPSLTCGTAGGCGSITTNPEHTVGTGIFASPNQVTYTFNAPASVPSGNTVTINFSYVTVDNRSGTLGNSRTLTASATVTIVNSGPTHLVAVGPAAADLQMQPSYSDSNFNVRQFNMEFNAIANFATTFTWTVDGVTNGNATVGTIQTQSSLALYTSPTTTGNHTICAVASDSTQGCSTVKVSKTAPIVAFDLKAFAHKNGYEYKECSRCLFENSLIENSWGSTGNGGGQNGTLLLLQPINQANQTLDGSGANVGYGPQFNSDITVRYIKGEHISAGLVAVPLGAAKGMHRVSFTNILCDDCDYTKWGNGFTRINMGFQTMGTASTNVLGWESASNPPADNVTFRHITYVGNVGNAFGGANNLAQFKLINFNFLDSIIVSPNSSTFTNPNGDQNDCNTAAGAGANNTEANFFTNCVSPYTFNHLALVNSTALASVFTSAPIWQPSTATVAFVNANGFNGGDYRLCKTSLGCSSNSIFSAGQADQASDGTDLGADVTGLNAVEQKIRGVTPPPPGIYVATTGSDSNPCTFALPCVTIAHGIAVAGTGVVVVESGTYTGFTQLTVPTGITLQSQTQYGAILQAPNGDVTTPYINISGSNTTVQGFEIIGQPGIAEGVKCNGTSQTNCAIIGNKVHGFGVQNTCQSGAAVEFGSGVTSGGSITGNYIYNVGPPRNSGSRCNQYHGIYVGGGTTGIKVQNNVVFEVWQGYGLHINSSASVVGGTFTNNTMFNDGDNNGGGSGSASGGPFVLDCHGTCSGNLFNNNLFYTTQGVGPFCFREVQETGASINNNTFSNNLLNACGTNSMVNDTVVNTVSGAPQFASYTGDQTGDYRVCLANANPVAGCTGTSPAVGAGTANGAPSTDFQGLTQTTPPVIGAYTQ